MEERREFERFDLKVQAGVMGDPNRRKPGGITFNSRNISAGGAFFLTDKPLPEGKKVQLTLVLGIEKLRKFIDSKCQIKVNGTVVRSENGGMAICFHPNYRIMPTKSILH